MSDRACSVKRGPKISWACDGSMFISS
jgi:hypothetical protein